MDEIIIGDIMIGDIMNNYEQDNRMNIWKYEGIQDNITDISDIGNAFLTCCDLIMAPQNDEKYIHIMEIVDLIHREENDELVIFAIKQCISYNINHSISIINCIIKNNRCNILKSVLFSMYDNGSMSDAIVECIIEILCNYQIIMQVLTDLLIGFDCYNRNIRVKLNKNIPIYVLTKLINYKINIINIDEIIDNISSCEFDIYFNNTHLDNYGISIAPVDRNLISKYIKYSKSDMLNLLHDAINIYKSPLFMQMILDDSPCIYTVEAIVKFYEGYEDYEDYQNLIMMKKYLRQKNKSHLKDILIGITFIFICIIIMK